MQHQRKTSTLAEANSVIKTISMVTDILVYIYMYIFVIYIYIHLDLCEHNKHEGIYMIQCIKTTLIILVSLTLFSTFWSDIKRGHSDGTLKGFLQGHLVPWSMTSQEKKHCGEEC